MSDDFEPSRGDLIALIDWLALPYAGDPVWEMEGEQITEAKARLKATWQYVIGTKGPSGPGAWAQCRCCGIWQVVSTQDNREAVGG